MKNELPNKQKHKVSQGRLPGGGKNNNGAGLEGCIGIPQRKAEMTFEAERRKTYELRGSG